MARFNTRGARAQPVSRVTSTGRVLRTYEGGRGRERDARSELFLLAIASIPGSLIPQERIARHEVSP